MARLKDYLIVIAGDVEKATALLAATIGSTKTAEEVLEGKITLSQKISEKLSAGNAEYDAEMAVTLSKADHVDYKKANAKGSAAKVKPGKSPAFGDHSGAVRQREF